MHRLKPRRAGFKTLAREFFFQIFSLVVREKCAGEGLIELVKYLRCGIDKTYKWCALEDTEKFQDLLTLVIERMLGIKTASLYLGLKEFLRSTFAPHGLGNTKDSIFLGWPNGFPLLN